MALTWQRYVFRGDYYLNCYIIRMNQRKLQEREPKMIRHEEGKEKCRIYHRSLSSKGKNLNSSRIQTHQTPLPGQFAINRPEFRLTTNIKAIMKESKFQTAANFLSHSSQKKLSIGRRSTSKIKRIQQTSQEESIQQQKREATPLKYEDRKRVDSIKKNSYMIKTKIPVAKFSSGYKAVKLQTQPKLKLTIQSKDQTKQRQTQVKEQNEEEVRFLPLQYYLMDEKTPQELLQQFRIGNSEYVLGYSRWYGLDGNSSWKKCRVLGYSKQNARWNIEWLHNGKHKQVSRANLYFEGQSKQDFENRLHFANSIRQKSEAYYRYHIYIDQMEVIERKMPKQKLQNIMSRVNFSERCRQYTDEVQQLYIRSNKQVEFNSKLPYDEQKKCQFKQFLPWYLFKPHQQHMMRYKGVKPPQISPSSKQFFQSAEGSFKVKTSLTNRNRLQILSSLNEVQEKLGETALISQRTEGSITLDRLLKQSNLKSCQFLKSMQQVIFKIQHWIGVELDTLYLDKKNHLQEFEKQTKDYSCFLSMVIIRLEAFLRQVAANTFKEFTRIFRLKSKEEIFMDSNRSTSCLLELKLVVKESKIDTEPSISTIRFNVLEFMEGVVRQLSLLHCPSKAYLQSFRKHGYLLIENQPFNLYKERKILEDALRANLTCLQEFLSRFGRVFEDMLGIGTEIKNKMQKKYSYSDVEELLSKMKLLQRNLSSITQEQYCQNEGIFILNLFAIRYDDLLNRAKRKMGEGFKQLYRLVFEKISKENEKIEKSLTQMEERLQKQPQNIIEMLELEKLIKQEAGEELERMQSKLKQLPGKIALLESIQPIEYRDYQFLNHTYVLPIRLKEKVVSVKKDIQANYRKRFGEELNRDAGYVLKVARECNEQMLACFKIQSLEEMCDRFMQFSRLNQKIKAGIKEASLINQRQEAMSWSRTDFGRLVALSNDFKPYYTLLTLAKNYQVHLQILSSGSFNKIDPVSLEKELEQAKQEFLEIKNAFNMNVRMLRITLEVQQQYSNIAEHLPLIKALRNPDIRERHWVSIRDLIATNPQDDEVSLNKLINSGVQTKLLQFQEISAIASRELVYERRLLKLKREWKEVRFHFELKDGLFNVVNLKELCDRVELDIFQVQQMLGTSFIKFLQGQILCWRNQVLHRSYELLEKWQKLQSQVILLSAIFSKPRIQNQLPREHFQFQLLDKSWRGLFHLLETQPFMNDVLQSRAMESLTALENTSERIRKQLKVFFEDKKRQYARLACISDDQFVNLLSYDEADPGENPVFEQTVRKCFQNIKALIRNEQKEIIKIKTCGGEVLHLKELNAADKIVQYVLPNEVIMQLETQIQKQLRQSLEMFVDMPHQPLTQVLLLYQRLSFTSRVEEELLKNQLISPQLIRELQLYRDQLVEQLPNRVAPKHQIQIIQALYHLQLATSLFRHEYLDIFSFHWLSQPRTYLRYDQYVLELGLFSEPYGFEIVDVDQIIIEECSSKVFCSMAAAIQDRGMCMLSGHPVSGKRSLICKLASLFGRKEHILQGGPLLTARNLLQFVRMAASGLWVVLRHVECLDIKQLSILSRNVQYLWSQFLTHPSEGVIIENAGINFKTSHLKIFATTIPQTIRINEKVQKKLGLAFRYIFLPKINLQFIIGAKLLLLGVEQINPTVICLIIEQILSKFKLIALQMRIHSSVSLTLRLFEQISAKKELLKSQQLFQAALSETLMDLVKDEKLFDKMAEGLFHSFGVKLYYEKSNKNTFKTQFASHHYYYNQHLLNCFTGMIESMNRKSIIILVGPHDTGKSGLTKLLKQFTNIRLHSICPNAYSEEQLYGRDDLNGIICCLLQKVLKSLKKQEASGYRHGLLLDGELGSRVQPLAKMMNSGHIIQPNGNRLLIQQDINLVFQCLSLEYTSPDVLIDAKILPLLEPLKWQHVFNWYLHSQFDGSSGQSFYIKYFELLIPYIVDPMMEFYQATQEEYKHSQINTFVPPIPLVLSLLRLYESLLRYQFLDDNTRQFNEKISSDSFNIFIMAIVWTFGASLPFEARKSFQRHFKYLIKRAVQVHMSAVAKESLPEEDQDLFNNYYNQGRWEEWKRPKLYLYAPVMTLNRASDIGLSFIIERTLERGEGFIVAGPNNGFKTLFMNQVEKAINPEAYKILKIAFKPNSTTHTIQKLILKQMSKEKYSSNFKGFAHGKKTIILIRDLSLPLLKQDLTSSSISIYEFIRHYYVTGGWYLSDSDKHFSFKNIIFCATMNYSHPLPVCLSKYISITNRPVLKQDLSAIVNEIVKDYAVISPSIGDMIVDLHFSISKEFKKCELVPLCSSQAVAVAKGLKMLGQPSRIELMRFWIFLTEKVYLERLLPIQMERIFYLINNLLMQKQKLRYKSIKPNPEAFGTYLFLENISYYTFNTLKNEVEKRWNKIVGSNVDQNNNRMKCTQKSVGANLSKSKKHVAKSIDVTFKPEQLRLIAYFCSTFDMHTSFVLSLSIAQGSQTPTLDIQQALQITAVLRNARVLPVKIEQNCQAIWKNLMLSLIQQMLTEMQNGNENKQTIIFFYDFKPENDLIVDDLISIKRNNQLPFEEDTQKLFDNFLQSKGRHKPETSELAEGQESEYFGYQNRVNGRERKFQTLRKQRERDLKWAADQIISKIKVVINIKGSSMNQVQGHHVLKYYEDMLREFSIINMKDFRDRQKIRDTKEERITSAQKISVGAQNPMITDINQQVLVNEEQSPLKSSKSEIFLNLNEETFLDSINSALMNHFCLVRENQWQRGKKINIKTWYSKIKERLSNNCHQKIDQLNRISSDLQRVREARRRLQQSIAIIKETQVILDQQFNILIKQKSQKEADYDRIVHQNKSIERNIVDLERERAQLQINYDRNIEKQYKQFCHEREELAQCIKMGKEKKIATLSSQFKALLQALSLVLDRKIKKEEQHYRQIIKDINNPVGNLKIVKKLSGLMPMNVFSISDKVMTRVREVLKNIDLEKSQKRLMQQDREETFSERISKKIKHFFIKLFDFQNRTQQKQVKEYLKRLNENEKQDEKLKDSLSRNLKSNEYRAIFEHYQSLRQKIAVFEEKKKEIAFKRSQCQKIAAVFEKCFQSTHLHGQQQKCGVCSEEQCSFMCWVELSLKRQGEIVDYILRNLSSFTFTLLIVSCYRFDKAGKDLQKVIDSVINNHRRVLNCQQIRFSYEDLPKLATLHLLPSIQLIKFEESIAQLEKSAAKQANYFMALNKEFEENSILALIHLLPGTLILGVKNESLSDGKMSSWKSKEGTLGKIHELFGNPVINSSQLLEWMRTNGQFSKKKLSASSRVLISNKNLSKSMISIANDHFDEEKVSNVCLVVTTSRQEYRNCIKILNRQRKWEQFTIVVVAERKNVDLQTGMLTLEIKHQDLQLLTQKIENVFFSDWERGDTQSEALLRQAQTQKYKALSAVYSLLDLFSTSNINNLIDSIQEQAKLCNEEIKGAIKWQTNHQIQTDGCQQLEQWVKKMREYCSEWKGYQAKEVDLSHFLSEKAKSYHSHQKMVTNLSLVCETLLYFQAKDWLPRAISTNKYIEILTHVFEANHNAVKKSIAGNKQYQEFKMLLWNHIASLYPGLQLIVLVVFLFAYDCDSDNLNIELIPKTLHQCLQIYQRNMGYYRCIKSQQEIDLMRLLLPKTSQNQVVLSKRLKKEIELFQLSLKEEFLSASFQNNAKEWHEFIRSAGSQTLTISPELSPSIRLLIFLLLCLFKPLTVVPWLKRLDSEGFLFKQEQYQLHIYNNVRSQFFGMPDISFHSQWLHLPDRLFYHYHNLSTKQIYLLNRNTIEIVSLCQAYKINYEILQVSTLFWRMDKLFRSRNSNETHNIEQNQAKLNSEEQLLIEDLKNLIKGENWIIINLNYHKMLNISLGELQTRVNSLFEALLYPEKIKSIGSFLQKEKSALGYFVDLICNKSNKNVEMNQYKYMLVYLVDSNPKMQSDSRQEIILNWLQLERSCISWEEPNQLPFHQSQPAKYANNFIYEFYLNLYKFKKNKKDYQKLSFLQKKIIFQFVFISHKLLQQIFIGKDPYSNEACSSYLQELLNRIYSCINIVKTSFGSKFTGEDEELIKKYQNNLNLQPAPSQKDALRLNAVMKLEEYALLLFEYAFEINHKTKQTQLRLYVTYEYIATIRTELDHLANYDIEAILTYLKAENRQYSFISDSLVPIPLKNTIDAIYSNFDPEKYEKMSSNVSNDDYLIKEQEQKLINIMLSEVKIDFQSKSRQIESLFQSQWLKMNEIIEILRLFDLSSLQQFFRQSGKEIENALEKKHGWKPTKLSRQQKKNVNIVVMDLLTQLLQSPATSSYKQSNKQDVSRLNESFVAGILSIYKRIQSILMLLSELRELVEKFDSLKQQPAQQATITESEQSSSDQEENVRKKHFTQLKQRIKRRVAIRFTLEQLNKKLQYINSKLSMQTSQNEVRQNELSSIKLNNLYSGLSLIVGQIDNTQRLVSQAIKNFTLLEEYNSSSAINIQKSSYSSFDSTLFIFRFQVHDFYEIIQLSKHIHAKKHHQQLHLLGVQINIAAARRVEVDDIYQTYIYFKGFSLVNAGYKLFNNKIVLEASPGNVLSCEDLYIEVVVREELEPTGEQQDQNSPLAFKLPFYLVQKRHHLEHKERVTVKIEQFAQEELLKANAYFTNV